MAVPVALGLVLGAYLVRRHLVGLRFPVPWPDEGSFIWQAIGFRDRMSLFAPEVNPEREVMWMPPGFLVLEGILFKILPFSLDLARTSSALFICGAVVSVYAALRRFEAKLVYPMFAALFLFCPIVHVAGNVARMEGLELWVFSAGFLLLERRRLVAVGVLFLAPIVHPNGLFAVAFGFGFLVLVAALEARNPRLRSSPPAAVLARGSGREVRVGDASHPPHPQTRTIFGFRAEPLDWLVIGAAVICWTLYGLHVAQNFDAFMRDMEAQLRFKHFVSSGEAGGPLGRALQPVVWVPALLLVAASVLPLRRGRRPGALLVLAVALLAQTVATAGWLYEVYPAFALLVASAYAVDALAPEDFRLAALRTRAGALAASAFVGLVAFDAAVFRHDTFLERSLERATVNRTSLSPPYLTSDDRAAVARYLASILPADGQRSLAVQFLPDAEALVYEQSRSPKLHFVQQTFYEHQYDVVLLHDSAWFPPFVRDLELLKLVFPKGKYDTTVIRERDGTERWVAYRWR